MNNTFTLRRIESQPAKTFGEFFFPDTTKMGEVLEDRIRPGAEYVYGETAIPAGKYRLITSFSNRFQREMIQLINIRGNNILFGGRPIDGCGIRIHGGNTEADTLGCLLLGSKRDNNKVFYCGPVNEKLFELVKQMNQLAEVYLNITNNF